MRFYLLSSMALLLFSTIFYAVTGCDPVTDGYRRHTVDKGFARFSFEYPRNWHVHRKQIPEDCGTTIVLVSGPWSEYYPPRSNIVVYCNHKSYTDAKSAMERKTISREEWGTDFIVTERSTVEVAGVAAEQAICAHWTIPIGHGEEYKPVPLITRVVYFDYGGFVWSLNYICYQADSKKVNIDFDHLLSTFTILD